MIAKAGILIPPLLLYVIEKCRFGQNRGGIISPSFSMTYVGKGQSKNLWPRPEGPQSRRFGLPEKRQAQVFRATPFLRLGFAAGCAAVYIADPKLCHLAHSNPTIAK